MAGYSGWRDWCDTSAGPRAPALPQENPAGAAGSWKPLHFTKVWYNEPGPLWNLFSICISEQLCCQTLSLNPEMQHVVSSQGQIFSSALIRNGMWRTFVLNKHLSYSKMFFLTVAFHECMTSLNPKLWHSCDGILFGKNNCQYSCNNLKWKVKFHFKNTKYPNGNTYNSYNSCLTTSHCTKSLFLKNSSLKDENYFIIQSF